jgi:conjugative relaxase-like TrwC/TraI family protein
MLTIRAMSDGRGYSARHLEHSDYFSEGERIVGRWFGRGAEMLGLKGSVRREDFEALRQGLDPRDGEFLRQRQGADRVDSEGETRSRARHLYDFTFSAPKSVSIMAVLCRDERLREAHTAAVAAALREVERYASARVRQHGANSDRMTGNLALAVYEHDASRELDPQLHTHAVAANLTYDGTEDRWKALQAGGIYERRAYLTEVYRNTLACGVRRLGYSIEDRRDERGRDTGFEICGVPSEILTRFSRRSQQRDEAIRAFVEKTGKRPTDNEVAVLVRETRADKLVEISSEALGASQRERISPEEFRSLLRLRRDEGGIDRRPESPEASLQYALDHVFERVSVAHDHQILTEALRHGRGRIDMEELKRELARQEFCGSLLREGGEVATLESLNRERQMIACVNRGMGSFEQLGAGREFIASDTLRPEQKRAVEFVLQLRDRAVAISGAAGTGKTATLRELRRGLLEAGRQVIPLAPTMSAVTELQAVGFRDAMTVERMLQDRERQASLSGAVVVLDEAGMVSGRQMSALLGLAERSGARIVFTGDTRQIQSVEAGDALRILENESRLKKVSLLEVQRQTDLDYRRAIEQLRRDPDRGFERLQDIGAVREAPSNERASIVATEWNRACTVKGDRAGSVLVICPTHDEIARITDSVRECRKAAGELGEGRQVIRDVSLGWTAAQKGDWRNFRPGHVLAFHRAVKGIERNSTVEVMQADENGVVVRGANGKERTLTRKQAHCFDVFERRTMEVAEGDRLLLTANRREPRFRATNGEIATVDHFDVDGRICLEDGRVAPLDYTHLAYGYAVTAHRSQGKSVDAVIVSADGMARELFYVAVSRGRQRVTVVTSDAVALRESVGRTAARQSATELARKALVRLQRGVRRGLAAGSDMIRHARLWPQPDLYHAIEQPTRERQTHEHGISR